MLNEPEYRFTSSSKNEFYQNGKDLSKFSGICLTSLKNKTGLKESGFIKTLQGDFVETDGQCKTFSVNRY